MVEITLFGTLKDAGFGLFQFAVIVSTRILFFASGDGLFDAELLKFCPKLVNGTLVEYDET